MIILETELARIRGLSQGFISKLAKLNIKTVRDLIFYFPTRYDDFSKIIPIADLSAKQTATIRGVVRKVELKRTWKKRMVLVEATVTDETGGIKAIWFNQPYIAKILRPGLTANFSGKIAYGEGEIYLSNPAYEPLRGSTETAHTGRLVPVYPETRGLTSRGIRYLLRPILKVIPPIQEFIPAEALAANRLPEVNAALRDIHFPRRIEDAESARERFAFEDLFLLQLANMRARSALAKEQAHPIKIDPNDLGVLIETLPFKLTPSQEKALEEILSAISKGRPMNRLLQGDVGSGKTVVAAIAAISAARTGFQAAFMAPTEVLARQHHATIQKIFGGLLEKWKIEYDLLLGSFPKRTKTKIAEEAASGKSAILIGTHALIQENLRFKNLALVIVDEQHRFGVEQRAQLVARRSTQIETQIDADNNGFLYKDLTYQIRGAAFDVANRIGLGLKENIYQKALEEEFKKRELDFEKEKIITVSYEGKDVGVYRPDFVMANTVIVEIKALPFVGKIEEQQLWSYLKGSNYKVALLINFGGQKLTIKRLVYDLARGVPHLRESASYLRPSAVLLPHFLSMSATPIPRTLSLTLFGDLDISIIGELPKGRGSILTKVVSPENRAKAHVFVREQIKKGRQAFVICPRIEPQINADKALMNADMTNADQNARLVSESESKQADKRRYNLRDSASYPRPSALWEVKAVKAEHERLSKNVFPDLRVGMMHGKLGAKEKERVMNEFKEGMIDVLVSTSVVEVGVDVPNATVMIIEGAERFGLAQLYQFRGRIGRGEHQSFCFLFTESSGGATRERLNALLAAKNGFELAELDLKIRGPGEFLGGKQTGLPDIAMKALANMELVKASRDAAEKILTRDPEFKQTPLLKEKLSSFQRSIHLE